MLPRVEVKQLKQSADQTRSEVDEELLYNQINTNASIGQEASGGGECSLGARIPSWTVNVRHIETAEHQQRSKLKKLQLKPGGLYASYGPASQANIGQLRLGVARQL